jgi:hypothetical protein
MCERKYDKNTFKEEIWIVGFFSFFWYSYTNNHLQQDLAIFGYKLAKIVKCFCKHVIGW